MSADEILPGVDVAALRGRFLALGGKIYKHRGDDRWVAPGQKPVRVHSGRQDATRNLIRLLRRLEAGAPPELLARAPALESRAPEPEPARVRLRSPAPVYAPESLFAPLDDAAIAAEAERIAELREMRDEKQAAQARRGAWRAQLRRADLMIVCWRKKHLVLYGLDKVKAYNNAREIVGLEKATWRDVIADSMGIGLDVYYATPPPTMDALYLDALIDEIARLRGRCDLLPTARWSLELRRYIGGFDEENPTQAGRKENEL